MRILVASTDKARARNNSEYLRVRYMTEAKEQRSAVLFADPADGKPTVDEISAAINGQVCEAEIKQNSPNDKIEKIEVVPDGDKRPFIRTTHLDVDAMIADMKAATRGDGVDENLTKVVDAALFSSDKRVERFRKWPAARNNHHAFQGGLLEHSWAMVKLAQQVLSTDPAARGMDRGVVLCAIVLHDFGKVWTYDCDGPIAEKNLLDGMLGHIVLTDELITRAAIGCGLPTTSGVILHLRHCALAHHGKQEWGSPVVPITREAELIHQLDMVQSRNQMTLEATENLKDGEKSTYHKALKTELVRLDPTASLG